MFFNDNELDYVIPVHPLTQYLHNETFVPLIVNEQEVILMVGSPASGKSTFIKNLLKLPEFENYAMLSSDLIKTTKKLAELFQYNISKGKSIIIDNCLPIKNGTFDGKKGILGRDYFIKLANKAHVYIRCFYFNRTKEVAMHLNEYRRLTSDKDIPDIVIHKFYKNLEVPNEIDTLEIPLVIYENPLLMEYY